jgi:hypothetical protein
MGQTIASNPKLKPQVLAMQEKTAVRRIESRLAALESTTKSATDGTSRVTVKDLPEDALHAILAALEVQYPGAKFEPGDFCRFTDDDQSDGRCWVSWSTQAMLRWGIGTRSSEVPLWGEGDRIDHRALLSENQALP